MEAVRTAPRPFLTVKEVMILLGCKEDFAYKTMRKINKESESKTALFFTIAKFDIDISFKCAIIKVN